jgi:hypothetical protein
MPADTDSLTLMRALLAEARGLVQQAQASIDNNQTVDLSGLESAMALLCTRALDLPPALRPQARAELTSLQQPIEFLLETLTGHAP